MKAVLRVVSGNFLEMYDFIVFGLYAEAIGRAFFPAHSDFVRLMASFALFWAAFLMRPLGALVLGPYLDRKGRRAGLMLTLGLMSVGTVTIAVMPSYAVIGVAAPALVLLSRLIQGFSAGVELGGVSVYLAEIAPPGRSGFFTAFQSASQQVAVVSAAMLGVALNALLGPADMRAYGWRIPLLVGCAIVPLLFMLRRGLEETEAFARAPHHPSPAEALRTLARHAGLMLGAAGLVTTTTVAFYLVTVYTPAFGRALHLPPLAGLAVTLAVGALNLVVLPASGALSDRIGRRRVLLTASAGLLLAAYPLLAFVARQPSFAHLLVVELSLAFLYAVYNGAMVVHLTEIVPAEIRASGFSLAYSLAAALFGGMTPLVSVWLTRLTGDRAAPGAWLALAAAAGFAATLATTRRPPVRARSSTGAQIGS